MQRVATWTDPRLADKQKSTLSQNSGKLHGLAPDFKRSEAVFQVDPLIIVELHILRYRLFGFSPARKFSSIQALRFQRPPNFPLQHCHTDIRGWTSTNAAAAVCLLTALLAVDDQIDKPLIFAGLVLRFRQA